jgi:hypothetical protein
MSRKGTNLIKVSMLLSISESDRLEVTGEHFDRAKDLIDEVMKDVPLILSSAIIANVDTQSGLNEIIIQTMRRFGGKLLKSELQGVVRKNGNDLSRFDSTLKFMEEGKEIRTEIDGSKIYLKLLIDSNAHF